MFGKLLEDNTGLTHLDLTNTRIGSGAALVIAGGIKVNRTLEVRPHAPLIHHHGGAERAPLRTVAAARGCRTRRYTAALKVCQLAAKGSFRC